MYLTMQYIVTFKTFMSKLQKVAGWQLLVLNQLYHRYVSPTHSEEFLFAIVNELFSVLLQVLNRTKRLYLQHGFLEKLCESTFILYYPKMYSALFFVYSLYTKKKRLVCILKMAQNGLLCYFYNSRNKNISVSNTCCKH